VVSSTGWEARVSVLRLAEAGGPRRRLCPAAGGGATSTMVNVMLIVGMLIMMFMTFAGALYILVYFQHEEDRNTAWAPKIVVVRAALAARLRAARLACYERRRSHRALSLANSPQSLGIKSRVPVGDSLGNGFDAHLPLTPPVPRV